MSILGQDPAIGHLTMEITKPTKEGRIKDMSIDDFSLHFVDLEEVRHDTKLGLWKSINEVIEGHLESLKLSKVRMKAEIHELNSFIRQLATPLASIFGMSVTSYPTATDVHALISQLQEDKHFRQIGREWTGKLKLEGLAIIEQINNVILSLKIEKNNISTNRTTLAAAKAKSEDCVSLLKIIIHMKAKEAVEVKIFLKGDEPLFEWLQSMQFKSEMIMVAEEGLKQIEARVKKDQDKDYELLRGLHIDS